MKKLSKKIALTSLLVFSFVLGNSFMLKSYFLAEKNSETKKPKSTNEARNSENTLLAKEEICDEENDEYLFVGCNGFF